MDFLGSSECSSGCESGWTLYLDHSVSSRNTSHYRESNGFRDERMKDKEVYIYKEEEEEDLSMVSDASSGPPNFSEDEACDFGFKQYSVSREAPLPNICGKDKSNRGKKKREDKKMASILEDTASSPFINFSSSNFDVNNINQASLESAMDSHGFSATHFQGRPAFQEQFGFFQSSLSGNQIKDNQRF